MIEVAEKHQELGVPASNLGDLFARLAPYIGRTIMLLIPDLPRTHPGFKDSNSITVGELSWLRIQGYSLKANLNRPDTPNGSGFEVIHLSSELRVLTDGKWVAIHVPEKTVKHPRELKSALAPRVTSTRPLR